MRTDQQRTGAAGVQPRGEVRSGVGAGVGARVAQAQPFQEVHALHGALQMC